jgi:hypothetical protein
MHALVRPTHLDLIRSPEAGHAEKSVSSVSQKYAQEARTSLDSCRYRANAPSSSCPTVQIRRWGGISSERTPAEEKGFPTMLRDAHSSTFPISDGRMDVRGGGADRRDTTSSGESTRGRGRELSLGGCGRVSLHVTRARKDDDVHSQIRVDVHCSDIGECDDDTER